MTDPPPHLPAMAAAAWLATEHAHVVGDEPDEIDLAIAVLIEDEQS